MSKRSLYPLMILLLALSGALIAAVGFTVFPALIPMASLGVAGFWAPALVPAIAALITGFMSGVALGLFELSKALDRLGQSTYFFRNWRLKVALVMGVGAALVIGLLAFFFPPFLSFFAGFSFFAVVNNISVLQASVLMAALHTSVLWTGLLLYFYAIYPVLKWIDAAFYPPVDPTDNAPETPTEQEPEPQPGCLSLETPNNAPESPTKKEPEPQPEGSSLNDTDGLLERSTKSGPFFSPAAPRTRPPAKQDFAKGSSAP